MVSKYMARPQRTRTGACFFHSLKIRPGRRQSGPARIEVMMLRSSSCFSFLVFLSFSFSCFLLLSIPPDHRWQYCGKKKGGRSYNIGGHRPCPPGTPRRRRGRPRTGPRNGDLLVGAPLGGYVRRGALLAENDGGPSRTSDSTATAVDNQARNSNRIRPGVFLVLGGNLLTRAWYFCRGSWADGPFGQADDHCEPGGKNYEKVGEKK